MPITYQILENGEEMGCSELGYMRFAGKDPDALDFCFLDFVKKQGFQVITFDMRHGKITVEKIGVLSCRQLDSKC